MSKQGWIMALGDPAADAESFGKLADDRPQSWRVVLQRGGRIVRAEVSG